MLIKMIWAIRVEQSAKLELDEFDCHNWMKKQKSESAKLYKRINRSNKFTAATQQFENKFLEQHRVWHSHHSKDWKLSIPRRLNALPTQMQNTFQIRRASCPSNEQNNLHFDFEIIHRNEISFWIQNTVFVLFYAKKEHLQFRSMHDLLLFSGDIIK